MAQRKVRARDVDRDVAIDVVEAAWADGQVSREEYDRRVDRLLTAPTLSDLEREILDLQPDGVNWQPRTATVPFKPTTSPPLSDTEQVTRNRLIAIAVTIAVIVVVALATRSALNEDQPAAPSQQTQQAAAPSMLSSAGFVAAREGLKDQAGSDSVYSAVLTFERLDVVRPTYAAGTSAVQGVFEDGQWGAENPTSFEGERLSLGLINAEAISAILEDAPQQAGKERTLSLKFQISRLEGQRVCITATSTADSRWTGLYDCRGQELTN